MFPGKARPWKIIDVIVSGKLDKESAFRHGVFFKYGKTLERKPKEMWLKVGKAMHVLIKELYSAWLEHYTKSGKLLLGIKKQQDQVFVWWIDKRICRNA